MKLLLDHNISHKLVARLEDVFPGSTQTRLLNFGRTGDSQLWLFAKTNGFVFVTKDRDLAELAILRGAPPKVIWLRIGNCKTPVVERILRSSIDAIADFAQDPEQAVLELYD